MFYGWIKILKLSQNMEDKLLDIQEILCLALKSLRCKIDKNPILVKSKNKDLSK